MFIHIYRYLYVFIDIYRQPAAEFLYELFNPLRPGGLHQLPANVGVLVSSNDAWPHWQRALRFCEKQMGALREKAERSSDAHALIGEYAQLTQQEPDAMAAERLAESAGGALAATIYRHGRWHVYCAGHGRAGTQNDHRATGWM